ncbi:uncharacterized protein LOC116844628, partial [Odontomachus brunneus]|uniref:uncharacterized protein LOC116844628 n=1 Tax=Odontomachus brunneus TaxID=486640 RepID=UPI0013F2151B
CADSLSICIQCCAITAMASENGLWSEIKAILTRDDRTTSHRLIDRFADFRATTASMTMRWLKLGGNAIPQVNSQCPSTASDDHRRVYTARRSRSISDRVRWLRLFIWTCCFIGAVHSAPRMTDDDDRMNSTPKWVNPCGLSGDYYVDSTVDVVQIGDAQLLSQIETQAKTALTHARILRDDYLEQILLSSNAAFKSTWDDTRYDWLPGPKEIPKMLGEKLDEAYLETLTIDTTLQNTYEYLQKFAVGIEQIVWEQRDTGGRFSKHFEDVEDQLRSILCEVQVGLVERGTPLPKDVSRSIMPDEQRSLSSQTERNLRAFIIYRDYVNFLEYIQQVFMYLRNKAYT